MSITINGATNTLTAASGLTIAGNTAVTGTLSASGLANFTAETTSLSINGAGLNSVLALLLRNSTAGQASPGLQFYNGDGYRHYFQEGVGTAGLTLTAQDGTPFNIVANTAVTGLLDLSAASSGQIKFPATQNASADANTLDDYEEGTWTPALTWSTPGDQSFAYSTQVGTYTKVGRLVTCSVAIVTSTHTYSTATGALQISGLPFTAGATAYEGASAHFAGITKASYTAVGLQVGSSSTVASLVASGSGQAVANIVPANVPSGTQVTYRATFSYIV